MSSPVAVRSVPYVNIAAQHAPMKAEILEAIGQVIDRGDFILGVAVEEFERRFAELLGVRHATGVGNGTDALLLSLRALGVGPGDEVITAPNSFVASASCISLAGARPAFADVGDDYNLDPAALERAITPRSKAILPVHLTGRPAQMGPIMEIAREHGLAVVEDCAQAVLATYRGQLAGTFGAAGCFSLHPLKTLNAIGDGGVIVTDDDALAEQLRILRNVGLRTRDEVAVASGNSRLDTLQAAVLLVKLKYLEGFTAKRRANAAFYRQALADIDGVQLPLPDGEAQSVYHIFMIQAEQRDELKAYLQERGIGTGIHYPIPIHLQPAMAELGFKPGTFPVAERQAGRILSLPIYPELEEADLAYVADSIRRFYGC